MKTNTMLIAGLTLGVTLWQGAMAQENFFQEADQVLDSDTIDVDGAYRRKSLADQLAEERTKLERQNEAMVKKKIEDKRFDNEKKLSKELRNAFKGLSGEKNVSNVEREGEAYETTSTETVKSSVLNNWDQTGKIRIAPTLGVLNIKGNQIDFESKMNFNVAVESMVARHVSIGASVGYASLDITEIDNSIFGQAPYQNLYGSYYNDFYSGYGQAFGAQRKLSYSRLNLDLYGKYVFAPLSRVRPYAGGGIGYNRTSLKYDDQGRYQNPYSGAQYGGEEYSGNFISGSILAGTEILFSESIGAIFELKVSKGLSSSFGQDNKINNPYNLDQQRLQLIGENIQNATTFGITAGMVIGF
jgi:hypothetical protein